MRTLDNEFASTSLSVFKCIHDLSCLNKSIYYSNQQSVVAIKALIEIRTIRLIKIDL